MIRYIRLLCLFVVASIAMTALSQDMIVYGDFDTYVAMLNETCPIEYRDAWSVTSFVADGDTVRVEVSTPASLAGFMGMLIGDGENVKKMWVNQLMIFGNPWADFFNRLVKTDRHLIITFHPKNSDMAAVMTYTPQDYAILDDILQSSTATP